MADEKQEQKSGEKPSAKKDGRQESRDEKSRAKKAGAEESCEKSRRRKKPTPKKTAAKKAAKKPAQKSRRQKSAGEKSGAERPAPIVVRASSRYVRVAPRKARLIADQVRGLHIEQARALLQFSPRGAAQDIRKLIESAASNAENNHDLIADEMRVAEITVDEGPTLRRFRPRALGRATRINKRTSHIAVALSPEED